MDPGRDSVSGFKNSMRSPRLERQPILLPAANPVLRPLRSTDRSASTLSAKLKLESSEALSTIVIWHPAAVSITDRTHFSSSRPEFQFTITMDITCRSEKRIQNTHYRLPTADCL